MKTNIVCLVVSSLFILSSAASAAPPPLAIKNCETLKAKLEKTHLPLLQLSVPADYSKPDGEKLTVFYWRRPALEPSRNFPPLLLVHGGPGGSSYRFLDWPALLDKYPGDVVAIDERGEGCSATVESGLALSAYANLRARNIVRDLERLRVSLYGAKSAWRYFGQSRGSVTGHYYLDMYPQSLESLHVHGYSMGSAKSMTDYSRLRAFFSARSSKRFIEKYPAAEAALLKMKKWLETGPVCFDFVIHDNPTSKASLCGAVALDALSFDLGNEAKWQEFASKLESLTTPKSIREYLQSKIEKNTYVGHFNYIAGTNAQDMGHPNPEILSKIDEDAYIHSALICEGRFVGKVMVPWYKTHYGKSYSAHVDPIHHDKILAYLKSFEHSHGRKFQYNLYTSENDPFAGPEAFEDERAVFGTWVNYRLLPGSSHDGWLTDATVSEALLKQ